MDIIITDSYKDMSRVAADEISNLIKANPKCVLGLATGSTPIGLYSDLVADCRDGKISFADVTTFNLDEYYGLPDDHEQSYHFFMKENLFGKVDIDLSRTHVPAGMFDDAKDACEAYERMIADAGGIDLQLLGLGHNGHIGFNEPSGCFPKSTHVVELTDSTIDANSRLFDSRDDVPTSAITMGVGTIMAAKRVLVVASGSDKAQIVKRAFFGPVEPAVPASILQFHPNVLVVVDEAAAKELPV